MIQLSTTMFKVKEKRGPFLLLQEIDAYNYIGQSTILNIGSIQRVQEGFNPQTQKQCLHANGINIDMTDIVQFYDIITGPDKVFIQESDIGIPIHQETRNIDLVDNFPTSEEDFIDLLLQKYKDHTLSEYLDELPKIFSNIMEINASTNKYKKELGTKIQKEIIRCQTIDKMKMFLIEKIKEILSPYVYDMNSSQRMKTDPQKLEDLQLMSNNLHNTIIMKSKRKSTIVEST